VRAFLLVPNGTKTNPHPRRLMIIKPNSKDMNIYPYASILSPQLLLVSQPWEVSSGPGRSECMNKTALSLKFIHLLQSREVLGSDGQHLLTRRFRALANAV
jgi:hypothetical protein